MSFRPFANHARKTKIKNAVELSPILKENRSQMEKVSNIDSKCFETKRPISTVPLASPILLYI
jgi:hypothetical protein